MISNERFKQAAAALRCKVSDIRAADEVESGGIGMQNGPDGKPRPIILFEPHVFWRELKKAGIDPNTIAKVPVTVRIEGKPVQTVCDDSKNPILYPIWGSFPYPQGQVAQWARLDRAIKIHRDSALKACSWGRYQILGSNWKATGCTSIQDFVNKMFKGDDEQLTLWVNYLLDIGLDDELRANLWRAYARVYNGAYYTRNQYDTKLAKAKAKWAKLD